jgi:ABC-2 type transport system ATP-binding protein
MIHLEHVTKRYGPVSVADDITLRIEAGEAYGLLGPNGAGKTTILRMVLGIEQPDTGAVSVFGEKPRRSGWAAKRRIGVVGEHQHLYEGMTPREYLRFFAELYGVERPTVRVGAVIDEYGIGSYADRPIRALSHGMRQKLILVRAIAHDPDLLILDEPIIGLDARSVRDIRDTLLALRKAGKTLLLCSHVLSEVERTSTRVGILHRGHMLAEGTLEELTGLFDEERELHVEMAQPVDGAWLSAVRGVEGVVGAESNGRDLVCRIRAKGDVRPAVSRALAGVGATVVEMGLRRMSLEEAYLTLTDQVLEGAEKRVGR